MNTKSEKQAARSKNLLIACSLTLAVCHFFLIACTSKTEQKFNQYYLQGKQLYEKHCSNCHQSNGTGLGLVYPPLNKSDYMDNNFERIICLMKNGISGELIVNGKNFNQPMPGVPALSDLEVAEIATYIYNTWENKRGFVEVKEVSKILNKCED